MKFSCVVFMFLMISTFFHPEAFGLEPLEPGVLTGRVTTTFGYPLEGKVSVYRIERPLDQTAPVQFVRSVRTDKAGRYEIDELPVGSYMVEATAPGWLSTRNWELYINPASTHLWDTGLTLWDGSKVMNSDISGNVRSRNDEPVANATVTISSVHNPGHYRQVRSDSEGKFEVKSFHEGEIIVCASKQGYKASAKTLGLTEDTASVEVILESTEEFPWVLDSR